MYPSCTHKKNLPAKYFYGNEIDKTSRFGLSDSNYFKKAFAEDNNKEVISNSSLGNSLGTGDCTGVGDGVDTAVGDGLCTSLSSSMRTEMRVEKGLSVSCGMGVGMNGDMGVVLNAGDDDHIFGVYGVGGERRICDSSFTDGVGGVGGIGGTSDADGAYIYGDSVNASENGAAYD